MKIIVLHVVSSKVLRSIYSSKIYKKSASHSRALNSLNFPVRVDHIQQVHTLRPWPDLHCAVLCIEREFCHLSEKINAQLSIIKMFSSCLKRTTGMDCHAKATDSNETMSNVLEISEWMSKKIQQKYILNHVLFAKRNDLISFTTAAWRQLLWKLNNLSGWRQFINDACESGIS